MKRYLYFTVFVSGMTTLAAEFSASRLIGNVFGTSNLVWASIIGLILIYLTAGYFLGGRWADRWPTLGAMYRVLAWGAFTLGLVPDIASPILHFAAKAFEGLDVAVLLGSFAAVLILFVVPVTLLGMISPFAIRLSVEDPRTAGVTSGTIYAISTLGSFIGTFLPVLLTIPVLGTRLTFLLFSLILLAVALIGMLRSAGRKMMLQHLLIPVMLIVIAMLVNQSVYNPTTLNYGGPWEQFLVGPFFYSNAQPAQVKRMAIVGLAAGTAARLATAVYGPIPIDGYELDPKIIEVGKKYFDENLPNLNIQIGDGRWNLSESRYQYDIIAVDAYRPPYIPPHMTTLEFYQICHDHLTDTGVLAINVGSVPGDRRLINGLATTMAVIFPSVHVMDIPGSLNTMIFATKQPTDPKNFAANLISLQQQTGVSSLLVRAMVSTFANLKPGYQKTEVFTDDRAPIEWIVNDMVVRFALSGGLQGIQQ